MGCIPSLVGFSFFIILLTVLLSMVDLTHLIAAQRN